MRWVTITMLSYFFVGMPPVGMAADTAELAALKEKYSAAKGQIDRAAFMNYTNGLGTLLQQSKTRGDVDAYVLLQHEQKETITLPIIPSDIARTNLVKTVTGYRAMLAVIEADRADQLANLNRLYIVRLDALLRELLTDDRLADAKRVKDEKDSVLGPAKPLPEKEPLVAPVAPANTLAVTSGPAEDFKVIKAGVIGPGFMEDVTELVQKRVVDGKLEIKDYTFLRGKLPKRSWGKGATERMTLVVQYKYKTAEPKTLRTKFGDLVRIPE
jgi:hypothetical protein